MRKGKINIVDIFVLVAIVAVVGVGLWYMFLRDSGAPGAATNTKRDQAVVFVAKATELEREAVSSIKVGDSVVALDTYQPGTILEVTIEPSKQVIAVDGELMVFEDETLVDLIVKIEAFPNIQEAYMDLGNQQIIVGNAYWIKTKDMHAQSEIISILER